MSPLKNYFWPELPAGRVELRGSVYVLHPKEGEQGVICWEGQRAREAQADLDKRVFDDLPTDQKIWKVLEGVKGWSLSFGSGTRVIVHCDTMGSLKKVRQVLAGAGLNPVCCDRGWRVE